MFRKYRNRLYAFSVLGVGIAAILALWLIADRKRPGVTAVNIAAIRPGMTYAEVESLMGCPSGTLPPNASDIAIEPLPESFVISPNGRRDTGHHWIGRRTAVFVVLDANGRVEEVLPLKVTDSASKPWWQFW